MTDIPIRPAATVIALRDIGTSDSRVLMGQRGAKAVFMPNKFVFPGGALDAADVNADIAGVLGETCLTRLAIDDGGISAHALAVAAIREFWEETGLVLGRPAGAGTPPDWAGFGATGLEPCADGLFYFFRAVTPPGRPRRFDARFFICDAGNIPGNIDDFSRASDELSHLQWVKLSELDQFNLPFITEVVLAEVAKLTEIGPPPDVPYFKNNDEELALVRIRG